MSQVVLPRMLKRQGFVQGFLDQFLSLTDNATSPENNITAVIYQMSGDQRHTPRRTTCVGLAEAELSKRAARSSTPLSGGPCARLHRALSTITLALAGKAAAAERCMECNNVWLCGPPFGNSCGLVVGCPNSWAHHVCDLVPSVLPQAPVPIFLSQGATHPAGGQQPFHVLVTGHSLGAGLAAVGAPYFALQWPGADVTCTTFGASHHSCAVTL